MNFKKILPHLVAIIVFLVLSAVYFSPQLEGKRIQQGDIVQYEAMQKEVVEFEEKTGETIYWNNGMFAGMPWRMMAVGKSYNFLLSVINPILQFANYPLSYVFWGMVICYLSLVLLGVNPWLSMAGAVAFGFNINHMVLIEAGHNNKIRVITYFPLILSGLFLVKWKKYLLGALLVGIGTSAALYHNHPQMLYYYGLMLIILVVAFAIQAIMEKDYGHLGKSAAFLVLAAILGLGSNLAQIVSTQNYSEDTMRGAPILEQENQQPGSSSAVEGLDWEYAMQWSNGTEDLLSIVIPRAVGGSSAEEVSGDSPTGRLLRANNAPRGSDGNYQAPMYWGNLNFTSGPYYIGAGLFFLFILSLFAFSPAIRYGLIAATLMGLLLSMGKEAEWLNHFLFDHFPYFNKFRAPNSLLVSMTSVFVIPAFLGLQKVLKDKKFSERSLFLATGIAAGIPLLLALVGPGLFDFSGPGDGRYNQQILDTFIEDRISMFRTDAFRSFLFAAMTAGLVLLALRQKLKSLPLIGGILTLLFVIDLFPIGKKYLDADNFVAKRQYEQNFAPRPVDQEILNLEPKGRGYYRVLDLSINTFNSASTSAIHNTIGGYNAAKLQRIQDMIDYHISKNSQEVADMLNTKYFIDGNQQLRKNPGALGNAWLVQEVQFVESPEAEINALNNFDPARQAIIHAGDFGRDIQAGNGQGSIELVNYRPDQLTYEFNSNADQLAVFSEVWYGPDKGWTATIDGQEADILRANYILRALEIPAGKHTIEFTFEPAVSPALFWTSGICSSLLLIGMIGMVVITNRKQ
jgi:hypothetical protein